MKTFLGSDEDFAKSRRERGPDQRVACFLHLRDLVYLHPEAAPAIAVSVVRALEERVIAEKAAHARESAEARVREASHHGRDRGR